MKHRIVRWSVGLYPVAVFFLSTTYLCAQSQAESPGVHLTPPAIGFVIGMLVFVGPAFYFIGKYDSRLGRAEADITNLYRMKESHADTIEVGNQIVSALQDMKAGQHCPYEPTK